MFKSFKQKEKLKKLVAEGKFSQEVFDRWEKDTQGELPKRLKEKVVKKVQGSYFNGGKYK